MIKGKNTKIFGGSQFWSKNTTIIGGMINLDRIIKQLFANSEQGFTQTLDDYSILYQDSAGTTPVTGTGQTLGLVLDKSKGLVLGSELVTNGDFSNGTTGWSVSGTGSQLSVSNGVATVTNGTNSEASLLLPNLSPMTWYSLSFDLVAINISGNIYFVPPTGSQVVNVRQSTIGKLKCYFYSGTTGTGARIGMGSTAIGASYSIDNISIKSILGNHSYQSTSSYRPLLQNTPRRVQYDGIDDKLTTTLPAQLTGCTVIRAIPNVGCQILTNQTIPTPYNDSTSHCGLIVINRALTAYETSLVTQIFNKLAGV
ncbi:hypothetical protein [Acinetobacter brisouii]